MSSEHEAEAEATVDPIVVAAIPSHDEPRTPITPQSIVQLSRLPGVEIRVVAGIGSSAGHVDEDFTSAGAIVVENVQAALAGAHVSLSVRTPTQEAIQAMPHGLLSISYLDAYNNRADVELFAERGISAVSLEMIPRSTIAQKMDALSSQHSVAGYYMVLLAAERTAKLLPMMTTPAGTIQPARVFIIGAGVAGLQAIATAKRLGARVEAFDTRGETAEQVQSLGAKFVSIDIGETGATDQGYAKALTDEQLAKQREGMAKVCAQADIVITTAQLFARKAPIVVTKDMVAGMKAGSIIVDYAVESGGNVEGSQPGEEVVTDNGVRIIGMRNYPGQLPAAASQVLATNCAHLLAEFVDESGLNPMQAENEIIQACMITHSGSIVNKTIREHYQLPPLADVTETMDEAAPTAPTANDEGEIS